MPSTSSGRIVKTPRGKKGTAHQKNHRWESFTAKVAKLNSLDPLRRVRRYDLDTESLDTTVSYFGSGLEKWSELNLSANFIDFLKEATPLADSLPQILHFENKIIDLLIGYLEKKDRESVEPLLHLLTDFAHDLGTRFEKHYERSLTVIVEIARIPQDVEVVEWTFTCLAFMFKYLSKLLVPDLRPTYDLVAPLLGKERQQPHIARFAAEAMSFLIKKAASPATRERALPLIVHHAKKDLISTRGTRQHVLYYHGLMTMFAESMKGNSMTVHTSATAVLKIMLVEADDEIWQDVVCGIVTSLVHHSNAETFKDVVSLIVHNADGCVNNFEQNSGSLPRLLLCARLLGVCTGVRKGSRISAWQAVLETTSKILNVMTHARLEAADPLWMTIGLTVSVVMQYSPMNALIPFVGSFLDALVRDPFAAWFLVFCSHFARVETERFQSIILPYFQRFVIAHWSEGNNEDALLVLVPKLVSTGAIISSMGGKDGFNLPQSWQDQIVSKFERLEVSPFPEQASPSSLPAGKSSKIWHERCLPKYDALLKVMECGYVHPSTNARIAEILLRKLKLALRPSSSLAADEAHFIAGKGFHAFSRMSRGAGTIDTSLEPLLRAAAPRYARLTNFLDAMIAYNMALSAAGVEPAIAEDGDEDLLIECLVRNLSTESHELRLSSLRLLELSRPEDECIKNMLLIENTPLDLQTARSASMHIRKLASLFPKHASEKVMSKAIPLFCFGMLTVKFAQIWDDASAALAVMVEDKAGEEAIAELAFEWLATPSQPWEPATNRIENVRSDGLTDFECSNLIHIRQAAADASSEVDQAQAAMLSSFESEQRQVPSKPATARSQALRVLSAMPQIAEKRSRILVPMFLSWAQRDEEDETISDWTKRDQKALLDLLSLFVNPRVLFRADEVKSALLALLANGDLETQKAALKAIKTWKFPGVRPYEENLDNLLDEARLKDEITILLGGQSLIQPSHREELMPILLRLLYGRSISRRGSSSGKQGMAATRLIVLRNLNAHDTELFLDIALGNLKDINVKDVSWSDTPVISVRKQVGFLHMMEAVIKELASQVAPLTERLLNSVLYCLVHASRRLQVASEDDESSQTSMLKVVRQTGLKCIVMLVTNDSDFDWKAYMPIILPELIEPRLEKLPIETAQGVSGLLQLFNAWSLSAKTVLLLTEDVGILPQIAACLDPPKSQDSVKLFALNIIKHIVALAQDISDDAEVLAAQVKDLLLAKHMDAILGSIGGVLRVQHDVSKDLLEACVDTVTQLAPFVVSSSQAQNLVGISTFLLDQPTRRVTPKTKSGLLRILEHFVPMYDLQEDPALKDKIYNTVTSLFGFFKDKMSREVLSRVLAVYSKKDKVLGDVARLCLDLNSFKDGRLEEPDYDRRTKAFSQVSKHAFNAYQWRPLLYNMLYFIRDEEEHAVLSWNSSAAICSFLDTASIAFDEFEPLLSSVLMPALFSGARESSEGIRQEYIKVMAHLVTKLPDWIEVQDMQILLDGENAVETSFFNNILTVGKGRQSSALSLLSSSASSLSSKNVSHFLIPLVEHFIFDRAEGNEAHSLAAEATGTMGILAGSLEWVQYRALLRRYIEKITSKPDLEKQIIRLVGRVIDALAEATMDGQTSTLGRSLPKEEKFVLDVSTNILPPLMTYLHDKDESTVSLRVPVAIIIVRLLKLLPHAVLMDKLPAVLTDICHILRSKAQESRDMTRDTLVKICVLLGPSCFGFILKELRGALARGYQLHVLSYTMHSMLVATTPEYQPGDLDYCLPSIVAIVMDDIFGATGQEKDAEEYVSKMKEVKSSKSHDSMELIAKTATLNRLTDLVRPIQVLLGERLNMRMVNKIDELLSRITTGLLRNPAASNRDSLVFCYEVIMDVVKLEPEKKEKVDHKLKKYLLQKGAKKFNKSSTTVYTHKLVRFAFDVMRTVLKKHDSLRTIANLTGFVPIIGDALLSSEEEVKTSAFKLLTVIVKVPLKDDLYKVGYAEAIRSISASTTTSSDVALAGMKLISVILRDRKQVQVKDSHIDDLLVRLKDDLTEPERRHVTFNFLRGVLDARIETAIVYDTLDHVGSVMVTNDDKDTRDLARGAYFQFLREYPQMKKRWSKQLAFIVANLQYEREGGRLSILEVIHLLLSKSSDEFVQEVASACFVPLVFVLVNDDSEKCRMAAGEVIKELFKKADSERMKTFLGLLRRWLDGNDAVIRLAFQSYGFYYEIVGEDTDLDEVMEVLSPALQHEEWELRYSALQLSTTICESFPERLMGSSLWDAILPCMSYPHAWVKLSAAKLAGSYFADFARTSEIALPMTGSQGRQLSASKVEELIRRVMSMFKTPTMSEDLATEIVKNVAFLGRVADAADLGWGLADEDEDEDDDSPKKTALQYIFGRLSFILRREASPPRAPVLIPKTAALRLMQILSNKFSSETLAPLLPIILLPLHNLTDPSIPSPYSTDELFRNNFQKLKEDSAELMLSLRNKVGNETYTAQFMIVRGAVKERREKRMTKRRIEAVCAPEKHGLDKKKKVERKKERRKERGQEHRDARHAY